MDALHLPCMLLRNRDSSTSRQCLQLFGRQRCLQTKGGIAVAIVIVKRSLLIHREFHICIICLDALRRHCRCQCRRSVINDDTVRADHSALVARLIHRIGVHNIAAFLTIQREPAVRCLCKASLQQLIIGQHLIICSILYPVDVVIISLYARKSIRGADRQRGRLRPDLKGDFLLRLLPVAQAKGDTVSCSRKVGRCGVHLNCGIQLHNIGNITRCSLPQIVVRLYTIRVALHVIEYPVRIAVLLR